MRSSVRLLLLHAALLCVAAPALRASAQPYHFEDALRDGTTGNATGGAFGADGWTVTAADDRIWYALPRLVSGYAEFTMANVTLGNLPLGDHEIFAMYEDGYGIGEPIPYAPQFRENHYKILMRIYGTAEAGRAGAMKLMWGMCPSGAPGHSECGCGSFFAEPFDDPGPWTGDPVRMRVEWGGGTTRLLRDGVEVVSVDWSGSGLTFGPEDLHLMLGSPRNDGGLAAMPIGAVFSDLVVDGTMGPLATCSGVVMPDGGVPADAGPCDPSTLAIADATAASWEGGVFPDANDLNVEGDDTGPSAVVYLRFAPVGGTVTRATLTLHTSSSASAAGGSGEVCRVDGGVWDESTLTWTTRPAVSTVCSGGARRVGASEAVTWDVTPLITAGGEQTLALVSTDVDGAHFLSREAGGCDLGPRLEVELGAGSDGGAVGVDGSTGRDGGGVDAGRADGGGPEHPLGGGCSCRAAGRTRTQPLAFGALGIVALAALRRRARRARRT